jgi:glutaredoxin 1
MTYVIYGRENCGWCVRAKNLLDGLEEDYRYIDINESDLSRAYLIDNGFKTVPQIWLDTKHIGGYTELVSFLDEGAYGDNC